MHHETELLRSPRGRITARLIGLVLVVALLGTPALARFDRDVEPVDPSDELAKKWGVQVVGLRLSGADSMLDFRFRVVDPEKAAPLVDRRIDPELIHSETGERMDVPSPSKLGPLRGTEKFGPPKDGRIYFVLFSNRGRTIKRGDQATVAIGDFRADLMVE